MVAEKRLIDANEAYEIARDSGCHNDFARSMADLASLREVLEECTTVDAVEVVRCKDCKRCLEYVTGNLCCTHSRGLLDPKPDDFCSYGERRGNDGN